MYLLVFNYHIIFITTKLKKKCIKITILCIIMYIKKKKEKEKCIILFTIFFLVLSIDKVQHQGLEIEERFIRLL